MCKGTVYSKVVAYIRSEALTRIFVQIATSPNPCTERNSDYVPPHNASATCVCSDTYDGADCSSTIADRIIKENQALISSSAKTGCFSRDALVMVPSTRNKVSWRPISSFQGPFNQFCMFSEQYMFVKGSTSCRITLGLCL